MTGMAAMWDTVFDRMLSRLELPGLVHVTLPDGQQRAYGNDTEPEIALRIADGETLRALCLRPDLALGEAYMDGRLTIEGDDLEGLLRLVTRGRADRHLPAWARLRQRLRLVMQRWLAMNDARRARANVAHHYDLSDALYSRFLDADMQYSCAYFADPEMTLEQAQAAKKAHIAAKLQIEPGMRVLDIGCGWGGMALTLARDFGAHVTGITLSQNQLKRARARAAEAGLEAQTDFRLLDYRKLRERFDRIVSVGMLEHVGVPHYDVYFRQVADLLAPQGVALIHTIASGAPPPQSAWITKYIFPGGYIPALSELAPAIEGSGLWTLDIEVLRLHYATTLRHWLARFDAHHEEWRRRYDERFIRMWRFYLIASYVTFEEDHQSVYQFQLAHRPDAVPITRDYLYRGEGPARAQAENATPAPARQDAAE